MLISFVCSRERGKKRLGVITRTVIIYSTSSRMDGPSFKKSDGVHEFSGDFLFKFLLFILLGEHTHETDGTYLFQQFVFQEIVPKSLNLDFSASSHFLRWKTRPNIRADGTRTHQTHIEMLL
jgi:hypothetical protein